MEGGREPGREWNTSRRHYVTLTLPRLTLPALGRALWPYIITIMYIYIYGPGFRPIFIHSFIHIYMMIYIYTTVITNTVYIY